MFTAVLAWVAVVAVTVAAVLFGQTARRAPRRRRRRSPAARVGLFLSLSGPWIVLLVSAGAGALTDRWLMAAAAGAAGVAAVALAGVLLRPR